MKLCILCGGVGHTQEDCPWVDAQKEQSVFPLFVISFVVAILSIVIELLTSIGIYGIVVITVQFICLVLEIFVAVSGSTWLSTAIYRTKFWLRLKAYWKHRKVDPDLCCCGCWIGEGGSICGHGGCQNDRRKAS